MEEFRNMNIEDTEKFMLSVQENKFRGKQLFKWINSGIEDFDLMTDMSKKLRDKLRDNGFIKNIEIIDIQKSKIDDTEKYLMRLNDDNVIECVTMNYSYGNTICISTQVGCNMNCSFCASGIGGKVRDLTAGEMIGQIFKAQKTIRSKISNIVLMGTGEPFDNFDNVMKFINIVNDPMGLNIGMRHITISTCGLIPQIKKFADMKMQITLAISLHSANELKRQKIMPISKKYDINELIEACNYYILKTNKRITFEYALIKGINDDIEDARELSDLLKHMLCHVNLIPINTVVENEYIRSQPQTVENFKNQLSCNGIECTIRRELGSDIDAACGQLRRKYLNTLKK